MFVLSIYNNQKNYRNDLIYIYLFLFLNKLA